MYTSVSAKTLSYVNTLITCQYKGKNETLIKRGMKRIFFIVFSILLTTSIFMQFTAAIDVSSAQPSLQYVPGEVVIGVKDADEYPLITRLIEDNGGTVISQLDDLNAVVARVSEKRVEAFMEEMQENSLVRYVERNGKVMLTLTPSDPGWSQQWGPKKIQADTAWNTQTGDKSILVAVVDTGVDWNHPDLAANYVPLGYDWYNDDSDPMDDHGHGTHCAGIIAAILNNGKGIAGLAQIRVMAEKFLSSEGWGTYADAASALIHAADADADIISNSWGSYQDSSLVHEAVRYAYNKGALLVAAAGNEGWDWPLYPAAYDEVVAVTATDQSDNPAWFTNFGSWVEVAAPGVSIYSTIWDNSYASWSGTSMATPHAAGVAALIWSQFPGMTRDQVRARLRSTADDLGAAGFDIYYGYGRINARKAVGTSTPASPSAPSGLTATTVSSSQIKLAWTDNSADESDFHIERKKGSGGTWSEINTVGANTVSYQDTGLSSSTTYYYRVRAHRHSDNLYSNYSNEASTTTQSARVPTSISIKLNKDTIKLGQGVTISGTLTANKYPKKMTGKLVLEASRGGSDWQVIKQLTLEPQRKSYQFNYFWKPKEAGDYTVRARYSGDQTYSASKSNSVKLTVKAR